MTSVNLISRLRSRLNKEEAVQLSHQLLAEKFSLRELIDVTFFEQVQVGFRASWILECVVLSQPQLLQNELDYFVQKFPQVTNRSVRRHFSKLLMWLLEAAKRDENFAQKFWQHDLEPVLTACFDWLIDPQERVAVKVQCMDCIAALSQKYPWAIDELLPTVEYLQHDATPAMQVRARRLLFALRNLNFGI
ncbi:MAG: hypothetical protein LBU92_05190 [Prevotellaceae bacterium]|nr:hypothetical protein [Prevotellaceae bacterium]